MPSKPKKAKSARKKLTPNHLAGNGHSFIEDLLDEHDYVVAQTVVDSKHIAMDWTGGVTKKHFRGESVDGGSTYRGKVEFPGNLFAKCLMTIQRFTANNGTELLLARWHRLDQADAGLDIILLSRSKE